MSQQQLAVSVVYLPFDLETNLNLIVEMLIESCTVVSRYFVLGRRLVQIRLPTAKIWREITPHESVNIFLKLSLLNLQIKMTHHTNAGWSACASYQWKSQFLYSPTFSNNVIALETYKWRVNACQLQNWKKKANPWEGHRNNCGQKTRI